MRGILALVLTGLLGGTIGGSLLVVTLGYLTVQEVRDLVEPFFTALVGLTGSAVGFYFGGRSGGF